jgi:hypothetical protein
MYLGWNLGLPSHGGILSEGIADIAVIARHRRHREKPDL